MVLDVGVRDRLHSDFFTWLHPHLSGFVNPTSWGCNFTTQKSGIDVEKGAII